MITLIDKSKYIVGFKVTDNDMKCRDFQFEIGKSYHAEEAIRCGNSGFHFCKQLIDCFIYYNFDPNNRVFVVHAWGEIDDDPNDSKAATTDIRIDHELTWHEVLDLVNVGKNNSGRGNSGNRNSGNRNSGNGNSGNYNSGYYNSGNRNSGNGNSGNYNSGNYNSGYYNSGNYNSGNYNSGYYNSGNRNSGNYNSGDGNSGNYNSGDGNSGNYNSCNYESGYFNSEEGYVRMFNKPTNLKYGEICIPYIDLELTKWIEYTEEEKESDANKMLIGGYLKTYTYQEAWANWNANATDKQRDKIKALPNYDADVFMQITGLDWRNI